MREREGWKEEGGGVQEMDTELRGRNMTIYEQTFMKQDGEHARGGPAAWPGSPSGASLTQQTCTHPPTRANTQKHTPRRRSACAASPTGKVI